MIGTLLYIGKNIKKNDILCVCVCVCVSVCMCVCVCESQVTTTSRSCSSLIIFMAAAGTLISVTTKAFVCCLNFPYVPLPANYCKTDV